MKISCFGALCAASLSASVALAKPRVLAASKTAPTYSNAADGYAVFLPGKPKQTLMKRDFAGKKIAFRIVSVTAGGFSYAVITTRAPAGLKTSTAARQLDFSQAGFLASGKSAGFVLLRREDLLQNGVVGRELLVGSKTRPGQIRARMFFKNSVSYQIVAAGPTIPNAAQRAQIARVLDSFRITAGAR